MIIRPGKNKTLPLRIASQRARWYPLDVIPIQEKLVADRTRFKVVLLEDVVERLKGLRDS